MGSLLSFKALSCSLVNRHLNLALEVVEILQFPCQTLITRISGYLLIIFLTVASLKRVQSFKFLPKLRWHLQIYWQHFKSNLFKRICEFEKKKHSICKLLDQSVWICFIYSIWQIPSCHSKKKLANVQVNLKYLPEVGFIFSQVGLITK